MNKKKAIKIATASAIAASGFVAVAPAQAAVKTTNVNTVVNTAISKMAAAYDGYHKPGLQGKVPPTAKIRQLTTNAEAAYDAAVAAIAKDGGTKSQKAAFTKKLNAKKYLLTRAQGYVKAIDVNLNAAKKALDKAVASGKAKDVKAAEAALVKTAATFEKAVKAVYGPSTRKVLVAKYHAPALAKAATVKDELTVYNAYKEIESGNLIEKDLAKAGDIIAKTKATVDKLAKGDKRDTKLVKNLLDAVAKNNAKYNEKAGVPVPVKTITAINTTTVEVTYEKAVENVDALKYSIEGLTIASAVVKQTDNKTVVLTTSTQEGAKEYTVKSGAVKVGTFKGVSAVIPTAVTVTTPSIQGAVGKQVTVKATVTVPEGQSKAGIPVTVNIPRGNSLNEAITAEVYTNANGEASYSYTRYSAMNDEVVVYATGDRSKFSTAKVYFVESLAVSEVTVGNNLANNAKKTYKVTGDALTSYYVAIKENNNVAPDKVTNVDVLDRNGNWKTPYSLTTGSVSYVEIFTDKDGEATFTVTGANASVTPIVYSATASSKKYTASDLQAAAPTVTFSLMNALQVSVKAEGEQNSAKYTTTPTPGVTSPTATGLGGRNYTATITDKDGKLATEGTVAYVTFEEGNFSNNNSIFVVSGKDIIAASSAHLTPVPVTVGKDGKVTFRVLGSGAQTFAKPTVFLNTAGAVTPVKLDKTDVQSVAEATYFTDAKVKNAVLTVSNASVSVGSDSTITYQSLDQNGFPYSPGSAYDLTFDVTSTFGNVNVKNEDGTPIKETQNLGTTKTYKVTANSSGKAVIKVSSTSQDTVSVNVSGANGILPLKAATVQFVGQASTLELVNAATKADDVLTALNKTYKAKLDILTDAQRTAIATKILNERPGSGYTQIQLDTIFNTEYQKLDTTKPAAPGLVGINSLTDNILSAAELSSDTAVKVNLNGSLAEAPVKGDVVKVTFNGKVYQTTLTDSNITAGNTTVTIPAADLADLDNKTYDFTATITDAFSNKSDASVAYTITVDKIAPVAPAATILNNTIVLSSETGANIKYIVAATASLKADVLAQGTSYTVPLTAGEVSNEQHISIVATDLAGNTSYSDYVVTESIPGTVTAVTLQK